VGQLLNQPHGLAFAASTPMVTACARAGSMDVRPGELTPCFGGKESARVRVAMMPTELRLSSDVERSIACGICLAYNNEGLWV